jgi:hypothetical protein
MSTPAEAKNSALPIEYGKGNSKTTSAPADTADAERKRFGIIARSPLCTAFPLIRQMILSAPISRRREIIYLCPP